MVYDVRALPIKFKRGTEKKNEAAWQLEIDEQDTNLTTHTQTNGFEVFIKNFMPIWI